MLGINNDISVPSKSPFMAMEESILNSDNK